MTRHLKLTAASLLLACSAGFFIYGKTNKKQKDKHPQQETVAQQNFEQPRIQAAILLDVSNSMDGLIEQAKAQLWNMVSVMGRAKCNTGVQPQIEIALYEYGRTNNPVTNGYVKQISPFTTDLDKLSKDLFSLTTNGGDEYCGQVIYTSLNELKWNPGPENYKVIFIAGNEDFLQGNLHYTKACALAKKNGVIVNTIYCGDRAAGIAEHWNLNAECGSGSFTNINQNEKVEDIPTPYDSIMLTLNDKLNSTYIGYGAVGHAKKQMQAEMDQANYSLNKSTAVKRAEVKSKANLYQNSSWDLVDAAASAKGEETINKLDMKTLPDSLQKKTKTELKQFIAAKAKERAAVQKEMSTISDNRNTWLATEKKKRAAAGKASTLETTMEKIVKEQAVRYDMKIE